MAVFLILHTSHTVNVAIAASDAEQMHAEIKMSIPMLNPYLVLPHDGCQKIADARIRIPDQWLDVLIYRKRVDLPCQRLVRLKLNPGDGGDGQTGSHRLDSRDPACITFCFHVPILLQAWHRALIDKKSPVIDPFNVTTTDFIPHNTHGS